MKYTKVEENLFLLRLERGEEIVESIVTFLQKEKIASGILWGLGAVDYARLAHYRVEHKEYTEREFNEPLEIASLVATITQDKIHSHVVLSDALMHTYGGHLKEAHVAATAEIVICAGKEKITRKFSEKIGLELLNI